MVEEERRWVSIKGPHDDDHSEDEHACTLIRNKRSWGGGSGCEEDRRKVEGRRGGGDWEEKKVSD